MTILLLIIGLAFAVAATVEWARLPLVARLDLALATAFALAAAGERSLLTPGAIGFTVAFGAVAAAIVSAATFARDRAALRR